MTEQFETSYEAPQINVVGTLADLTQGQSTGASLDAAVPAHTPFSQLTFS